MAENTRITEAEVETPILFYATRHTDVCIVY